MIISWILLFLVTTIILGQIFYIGQYLAVNNDIFRNNFFSTFIYGSIVYFGTSFLSILPFTPVTSNVLYYIVILIIKDIFTIIFLWGRRNIFQKIIWNRSAIIFTIIGMIVVPLIFETGVTKIYQTKPITKINDFHLWFVFKSAIQKLSINSNLRFASFCLMPIAVAICYSVINSLYLNFSKKESKIDYIITAILLIVCLFSFNFGFRLEDWFSLFLLVFAIQNCYNMIMFSRRRYGVLFGLTVILAWFINFNFFWVIFTIALSGSISYFWLKKPRPIIFVVQMMSPIVVIVTYWVIDVSKFLGFSLIAISILLYIFLVVFDRIHIPVNWDIFSNKKTRHVLAALPLVTIYVIAIIYGIKYAKINQGVLSKGNILVDFLGTSDFSVYFQNMLYYFSIITILICISIWIIRKEKIVKTKLIIFIIALMFLTGFNPALNTILRSFNLEEEFSFIRIVIGLTIIILSAAELRNLISNNKYKIPILIK